MDFKLLSFGKITRPTGKGGELEIIPDRNLNCTLTEGMPIFFVLEKNKVPFFISVFSKSGNRYRVVFDDIESTEEAQKYINTEVYIGQQEKAEIKSSSANKLIGYKIIDKMHGEIGTVTDVQDYPAQQILEISYNNKEILLPITPAFVTETNHKTKTLYTNFPEGLLDVYK